MRERGRLSDRFHLRGKSWWADGGLTLLVLFVVLYGYRWFDLLLLRFPLTEALYGEEYLWTVFGEVRPRTTIFWVVLITVCCVFQYLERLKASDLHPFSRWLFTIIVLTQTYSVGLMDYNHFYDSWYAVDRLLLFAFAALVLLRPAFTPLFILQAMLLTGQLRTPDFIGYDHVHKFIALPLLAYGWMLFIAVRFVRIERGGVLFGTTVMATLAMWYVFAGWGKYATDWQHENSLYFLFAAATDAGWLAGLARGAKIWMGEMLQQYESLLAYSTLAVEILLPILLFTRRWLALTTAVMLLVFHLSVYLFSGILFWQWSLLELAFILFLVFRRVDAKPLFRLKNQLVYVSLLFALPYFGHIGILAWYDCGFINKYTFYLVDGAGEERRLDATYFSPYDTGFAKNRFTFVTPYRTLANTYGQCNDRALMRMIKQWPDLPHPARLDSISHLRSVAQERYNERTAEEFIGFLRKFITNKNEYDPQFISRLASPPHMQQGQDQRNLQMKDLAALRIVYEEKIVLPRLEYAPVRSDTTTINLRAIR